MTEESHTPTTGMEHATEQAAWIIHGCTGDEDGAPVAARALAEAGLIAPAPLHEVRSSGSLNPRTGVLHFFGNDSKEYVKYHTDWLPVDRAEGDGRAET